VSLPAILAIVALVSAMAAGLGTWRVQDWRYAAKEKERLEQQAEARRIAAKVIDGAATGHEADKAQIRTEFITITKEVERVIQAPHYAADAPACLDADGLRELAVAIGAAPAASQPAPAVPRSRPAD
jgi:hypothetical protein